MQVGIIRQVEVELDNTLRDLWDSHKEEAGKLKKWRALNKDVQAKLAEFQLQGELPWHRSHVSQTSQMHSQTKESNYRFKLQH